MSRTGAPEGFEIAALRKKQSATWDPMAAGPGTPWEDRATHGLVGAFVKTCLASMTRPRQLADSIRRPETHTDARSFVTGCGLLWGLSAAGHVAWALYHKAHSPPPPGYSLDEVNTVWVGIDLAAALAGGTVGVVLLWMMYTAIYNRLVQQEARPVKVTEPVLANVCGYAFGPSLLAVVPVVGPVLALVGILAVLVAVGTSGRLRLRVATAAIDAVLGFVAIAAVGVGVSFLLYWASDNLLPTGVPTSAVTANDANQPAIRPSR